jgi:hypothetical protein
VKNNGWPNKHPHDVRQSRAATFLGSIADILVNALRLLGRACITGIRAFFHAIRRVLKKTGVFLGYGSASKAGSKPALSRQRSADAKNTNSDLFVPEISGGFIGSVLDDESGGAASGGSEHHPDASTHVAKVAKSVYWVRRIVALLVSVAVVAGVVFGVKAALSHTAEVHNEASRHLVDNSDSKRHAKQPKKQHDKKKDSVPDLLNPTVQPALTDQSRAQILADAQATATASGKRVRQYSYCVNTKGDVGGADVQQQFENIIFRTLNDSRGWPRAGATFVYSADSSHCDFVVYLAQPSLMTTFSGNCSDQYSCRVGNDVIVNEARWNGATAQMLQAGMSLDRYRNMVINHEVGHRLGHVDNEVTCPAPKAAAPLMQEQSIDLRGCTPNEWPTDAELWIK